jgi:tripartite-type tricarboxylate transporter receptor subunit TctC
VRIQLERAFRRAFESEEWQSLCRERGLLPSFLGRAAFEEYANEQARSFASQIPNLLRLAGAPPS